MRAWPLLAAALLCLPGCAMMQQGASPFLVTDNGQSKCSILCSDTRPACRQTELAREPRALQIGSGEKQRAALAAELQHWLGEVTGAPIPVEADVPPGRAILVGTAADFPDRARQERLAELGPEGFLVRSEPDRLWLLANTDLGLHHAVYAFLDAVGCRWYFADPVWTVVPKRPSLTVSLNLRETPAFGYRRVWYGWGPRTDKLRDDYSAWLKHNRQLGAFETDCGHAHARYVPLSEFEKHPEWFGLVKGKREPMQLCTSNPEAEQRVIEGVLALFRKEPQRNMASVDPNDGGGYCECDRCKALGSVSDRAFLLASHVARAVRKEFPHGEKWVGLYAYAFHCEPPRQPLEPGVYVQVTTGFRYTKLSFDEQVTAFRKLGARLGVYDYFSVYAWDWDLPGKAKGARVHELADAIRHYRDLGLSTYDAESACNWGPNGLGYWMASKLMWNPDLDPGALVTDFTDSAFGQAAEPMRRLYERWATGERFSARGLKLALLDLQDAYGLEDDAAVRARLDRVAMYLHYLRLWLDYERATRDGSPEDIQQRGKDAIVYCRRLMDTGLVHTYPTLFTDRFKHRFGALEKLKGLDAKQIEAWKTERTDIPAADEVATDFAADLKSVAELPAFEIEHGAFSERLVPLAQRLPKAIEAWGNPARSPMCVETGIHYFLGHKGEKLRLPFTPFDAGHTVDGHWVLRRSRVESEPLARGPRALHVATRGSRVEQIVAEGDVKAEKGKAAAIEVTLPADGVYALDPGTDYWKTAELGFEPRPLAVWAGRGDAPGQPPRPPFRLWLPRLNQPLYFFVPKGTRHFVVALPSVGQAKTTLVLRTADGRTVLEDKDVRSGDELSIAVPPNGDGAVWSLSLASLRCVVELYDVPPYLARHPAELLVPEEVEE